MFCCKTKKDFFAKRRKTSFFQVSLWVNSLPFTSSNPYFRHFGWLLQFFQSTNNRLKDIYPKIKFLWTNLVCFWHFTCVTANLRICLKRQDYDVKILSLTKLFSWSNQALSVRLSRRTLSKLFIREWFLFLRKEKKFSFPKVHGPIFSISEWPEYLFGAEIWSHSAL